MIIVSDEDDDGEIKTAAPIALGRDEGLGQLGTGLADLALGVGDDGTFCCEDDGLNKIMI